MEDTEELSIEKSSGKLEMKLIVPIIVGALIAMGVAFWGGTYYQKQQGPAWLSRGGFGQGGQNRQGGGFGRMGNRQGGQNPSGRAGGPGGTRDISGRLDRIEDGVLTLTTPRMGSIKITIDDKTKIKSTKDAAAKDLKVGNQVIVQGSMGQDGQMTATSVIGD